VADHDIRPKWINGKAVRDGGGEVCYHLAITLHKYMFFSVAHT